ncbi:MAG TPA: nuclear transport factor 2 family protein [Caldimonas sp.]|jgi:hypothetical protein|nr:nuclear transport factor 2 family protein [Caldimonas sp.]HEX2541390.1 nuclear transport factor 2 family protein [Caldimonas sp.]
MNDRIEELVERYCRGWSDPDPRVRERLLRGALAADATYTDPQTDALTVEQLLAHIGGVLASMPGARIERTSAVDVHHEVGRFTWRLSLADGTALPEGTDFVEFDAGGERIRRIVGFFGPVKGRAVA